MAAAALDAVIGALRADASLTTLAPGGVHHVLGQQNKITPYVLVVLEAEADIQAMGGRVFEDYVYRIVAVDKAMSGVAAQAAADRIEALLTDQQITVTGMRQVLLQRESVVQDVEFDGDLRYQFRGGLYHLMLA